MMALNAAILIFFFMNLKFKIKFNTDISLIKMRRRSWRDTKEKYSINWKTAGIINQIDLKFLMVLKKVICKDFLMNQM